ncbi:MAG: hypothetical protein ACI8TF_001685 [Paracoccaceae bacterium]|jgi:hypothetical protein
MQQPAQYFPNLLARAFAYSDRLSHIPLLSGYDELTTLDYRIRLFGSKGADVRQFLSQPIREQT